ncbi:MAG: hypothetical protein RRA92_01975 [Gemmatimonadota bacterium]|nr:hypothetical protein [Gemmatimonadota bacterium]
MIPALAAAAAIAAAWLRYGRREERVTGRLGPALCHAAGVFLLLAGLWLPGRSPAGPARAPRVALLDLSASMGLPARPDGPTRRDSALARLADLEADLVLGFADTVTGPLDTAAPPGTEGARSRLAPALRAARAAGARRVVVVSDGELEDRAEAMREADRLGLAVEEVRTAAPVLRTTVVSATAPARVRAGDTLVVAVEVRTPAPSPAPELAGGTPGGSSGDSITIEVRAGAGMRAGRTVPRPAPGRIAWTEIPVAVPREAPGWLELHVTLAPPADPLAADPGRRVLVEVVPDAAGIVLVSTEPDPEPGLLLPVLRRAGGDGVRAFLRVGAAWVEADDTPRRVPEAAVRSAARAADLLIVQGTPGRLPPWLAEAADLSRRLLVLARGQGVLPGGLGQVGPGGPGYWYAVPPPPSSPVGPPLAGLDVGGLPPLAAFHDLRDAAGRSALGARRDRRGEERPAVVLREAGERRAAVSAMEGTWRWALRTGEPRDVYRALFSGLLGWLLAEGAPPPVHVVEEEVAAGRPVVLAVAPDVRSLEVRLLDSLGATLAAVSPDPGTARVEGPPLPAGRVVLVAEGIRGGGEAFRRERPLWVSGPQAERAGRDAEPPLSIPERRHGDAEREAGGGLPPVWPFLLAACFLCGEWAWRRRLGLR